MDIFQFIGDFLHLIAVLMLLLKIVANKNVIGIASITQDSPTAHSNSFWSHSWPATSISSWVGKLYTFL
jgi:hypothetical protein